MFRVAPRYGNKLISIDHLSSLLFLDLVATLNIERLLYALHIYVVSLNSPTTWVLLSCFHEERGLGMLT